MPFDYHKIAASQKKALKIVGDPEHQRILEEFIDGTGYLVESAAIEALQELVGEINSQLTPHVRIRLLQEGKSLAAEVVVLGEALGAGRRIHSDDDTISKVLVRMPSNIKERASESAQRAGMSLNSWTVNILERALDNLRQYQLRSQEPQGQSEQPGPEEKSLEKEGKANRDSF